MCVTIYKRYKLVLGKIAKRFKGLQKICRGIALLDGILGLLILIILLVRQIRSRNKDEELNLRMERILVLVVQLFEIIFALVLYEGVRKRVSCMIKTWLIYCLIRFILALITLYAILSKTSELRLWRVSIEVSFTLFHLTQGLFILALQNDSKSTDPAAVVVAEELHDIELVESKGVTTKSSF